MQDSTRDDPITVIIPTYNRQKILMETINFILVNLIYEGDVNILIGNDGDDLDYDGWLFPGRGGGITSLRGPKRGLGANLNMLLRKAETDIVLQMDDDHWLVDKLDVTDYVRDLRNPSLNIGWIRLFLGERSDMYNLGTYYRFGAANYGPYWYLNVDAPELYLASNRPHIKRVDFHTSHYGWYVENVTLGKTEESFCHKYKDTRRADTPWAAKPWVTIPMLGLTLWQWHHVGDSWQKQGL